ncbi:MAG: hypothetical protein Q8922_04625 [Bacteroidota bacterium]|nr:hypothetical protein [Bacteroidota bacterium]MDP4231866.1 hypothetical protein [Bacteroidota bacterium]MDP4242752.1 hypothetical protein [Bacteroidota bacterium]MDP4287203.1 hypothetical protein [Bacteroidota bacterium]
MRNVEKLYADNHYHARSNRPLSPSSGFSNEYDPDDPELDYDDPEFDYDISEFDYDDPELGDLFLDTPDPFRDESDLRFLRDFILSCALYVEELESALCDRSDNFWEAREHAYRIITSLLIDVFRYEMAGD